MANGNAPDREFLLARQEALHQERNELAEADHFVTMGVGLAGFCVAMYATLMRDPDQTFTPAQALSLVRAAVQGR